MPDAAPMLTPAQFGENLFQRVFSPEAILRQIERSITEREFAIDQPDVPIIKPVPIFTTSTTGVAKIAPLGLRVLGPGRFDALVHVDIKPLTVTFNTGGVEMWDIEVDAVLAVQVSLHAPLMVQIDLSAPAPESVQINCLNANDSWGVSKGAVEDQIRKKLADTLNQAIAGSEKDRTVNLEMEMRKSMDAPKPVEVKLGPAAEDELPDLKLGVDGAYVFRADDADWVLRARARVMNGTAKSVTIGREHFVLAGWNTTSLTEGDFPTRIVLPPGASIEGNLGYYISGDHAVPRAVWFQVSGFTKVPWRRRVIVAECAALPIAGSPWPPGGRVDCARASAGFKWRDPSGDAVASVYLVLRNQGYAGLRVVPGFFNAFIPSGGGNFYAAKSTFNEILSVPAQSTITVLVSWYWNGKVSLGNEMEVLFGPARTPYTRFKVPLVDGEPMCQR